MTAAAALRPRRTIDDVLADPRSRPVRLTSSLAAAALHELGVVAATDVVGGFLAWRDAGLPTT